MHKKTLYFSAYARYNMCGDVKMSEIVTIKQIAEDLNISRNTVSKALNNKHVSEKTKELVLNKAKELGYKGFGYDDKEKEKETLNILLLAGKPLYDLDFFVSFAKGVENTNSKYHIEIFQYTYGQNNTFEQLKNHLTSLKIDGIIGIELYSHSLLVNILRTNIPIVFIDASTNLKYLKGNYDVLLMQSRDSVYKVCSNLIQKGYNRLTFCGDHLHCIGFNERFLGMRDSLDDISHRIDMSQQLLLPDNSPFGDTNWMVSKIKSLKYRPHVFVCANDSIARSVINALRQMNIEVPKDAQVIGFDNTIDSRLESPKITTINVDKELLGKEALYLLIDRIIRKGSVSKNIYINTDIIYRETTL